MLLREIFIGGARAPPAPPHATALFGTEKLIGERTDHRSDVLSRYEKISEGNKAKVSYLLGPNVVYTPCTTESCKQEHGKPINGDANVSNASFHLKISRIVIFLRRQLLC